MEHELKPCPFCGSETPALDTFKGQHYVACDDPECFLEGPVANTEAEAIEKWNRRADA